MIKVLVSNFHHDWGGQPKYLLDVACILRDQVETNFLVPEGSMLSTRALERGFRCYTQVFFGPGSEFWPQLSDTESIVAVIDEAKPDVIHVNGYRDELSTAFAARLAGTKAPVFKLKHNSFEIPNSPMIVYAYRDLFHHIGIVARGLRKQFQWLDELGVVDSNKFTIHHGGIPLEEFSDIKRFGSRPSVLRLISVARLATEKGLDILIESVAKICEQPTRKTKLELQIVGEGPQRESLQQLVMSLGLEKTVKFTGFVSDVRPYLAIADVFVLPSVDCEASSLALKEAMLVGLPVITTTIGGAAEIVDHGKNGFLIAPGSVDALVKQIYEILELQSGELREIGQHAKETIRQSHSISHTAASILTVYEELAHVG